MKERKLLVIHRRSSYEEMFSESPTDSLKKLQKRSDPILQTMKEAHDSHLKAMDSVDAAIRQRGLDATWAHDLSDIDPDDYSLVITVGGDGTVLHASHSIGQTPIMAVNSSPKTSMGYFTCTGPDQFGPVLDKIDKGDISPVKLHRMEVGLNEKVVGTRVLNDVLFCHTCPASTSRFVIGFKEESETLLSSGLWVCTAAGSTAAVRAAGGKVMPLGSQRLQFVVREPCYSEGADEICKPKLVNGYIDKEQTLSIRSKTSSAKLYLDGPHVVVPVEFGDIITFYGSKRPLRLYKNKTEIKG